MRTLKNKNIALIGQGKTGVEIKPLLTDCKIQTFEEKDTITAESLQEFDAAVVLIPLEALHSLIPTLMESRVPVVAGINQGQLPSYLDVVLKEKEVRWIVAHNFSLGLTVIHEAIRLMRHAERLFGDVTYRMKEVHNSDKREQPSAICEQWKHWLHRDCTIEQEKSSGIVGIQELILQTDEEEIVLRHQTNHRRLYARGAIWALGEILLAPDLKPGLHQFEELARKAVLHQ